MKSLFHYESLVMQFLTGIADLIILNVIYMIFCIPIVTIGAATTALYRVMLNYEKEETAGPIGQFWRAFCENLKSSTILYLIMLIPMICMVFFVVPFVAALYNESRVSLLLCCFSILLVVMIWSFLWPMQAQFDNSIGNTIKNSLILSILHFPRSILMSAINLLPLLLLFLPEPLFLRLSILWVLIGFSLAAKMNTKIVLKVFQPFLQVAEVRSSETFEE